MNWQGQKGAEGSAKEAWRKREAAEGSVGSSKFSSWRSERRLRKRAWFCGKRHGLIRRGRRLRDQRCWPRAGCRRLSQQEAARGEAKSQTPSSCGPCNRPRSIGPEGLRRSLYDTVSNVCLLTPRVNCRSSLDLKSGCGCPSRRRTTINAKTNAARKCACHEPDRVAKKKATVEREHQKLPSPPWMFPSPGLH